MKPLQLLLTSTSLVLALFVVLPLLGVATEVNANQLNLASPLLLTGAIILSGSFVLLTHSRRTIAQVVVTRTQRYRSMK